MTGIGWKTEVKQKRRDEKKLAREEAWDEVRAEAAEAKRTHQPRKKKPVFGETLGINIDVVA